MERLVNYIKKNGSKDNPIPNNKISTFLDISEQMVRKEINKARCEGITICSSNKGYWYSEDKEDILNTVQSLVNRTTSVNKAIDGMLTSLKVVFKQ